MSPAIGRPWRQVDDAGELVEALMQLFDRRGNHLYDEAITQTAHAVQAASAAVHEGADDRLVVAALLHDVGHLLLDDAGAGDLDPSGADRADVDRRHEHVAARFLANWFDDGVTGPIRDHVAAKRYLCATDHTHLSELSDASRHSLRLQGGPMSDDEVEAFERTPGFRAAVAVRRWDDLAKDPDVVDRPVRDFAPLVQRTVRFRN